MVVDTSALLALLFEEPHAAWVEEQLLLHAGELTMSTVNLTETLIRLHDQQPELYPDLAERVFKSGIRFVAPDTEQAKTAAAARLALPLNLGDCFAYALAVAEGGEILTTDSDFRSLDNAVLPPSPSPNSPPSLPRAPTP